MSKEIEIKIYEIDKVNIEQKLISLGAKKILDSKLSTSLFRGPNVEGTVLGTRELRIRTNNQGSKITWKNYTIEEGMEVNDELETTVSDPTTMKMILLNLGYIENEIREKTRISYKIDHIRFDIDSHEDIPTYMEIEAGSIQEVKDWVKQLGLENNPQSGHTYEQIKEIGYEIFIQQLKQEQGIQ